MDPAKYERLARAVAIVNAWLNADEATREAPGEVLLSYLRDEPDADVHILIGLMELAGILLVKLEALGQSPQAILADVAARYHPPAQ